MADGNPALFSLLIRAAYSRKWDKTYISGLIRLPRTELLVALGCDASQSTERFLRRTAFHEMCGEAERTLRALVEIRLPAWARHCRIPHLALLVHIPPCHWPLAARVLDASVESAKGTGRQGRNISGPGDHIGVWGQPHIRRVIEEMIETLRLIEYGLFSLRTHDARERMRSTQLHALERCKNLNDIQRVHQMVIQANQHYWGAPSSNHLDEQPWPQPPLPGTAEIQPVLSIAELREEGRTMHHCVATYAERIIRGSGYVYRVMRPERATLYLEKDAVGHWRARELRLACNRSVTRLTRYRVIDWVNEYLPPEMRVAN
ncbi:MAG: PcfJ domain-containing protein [Gammaproteobacteria bacterium]